MSQLRGGFPRATQNRCRKWPGTNFAKKLNFERFCLPKALPKESFWSPFCVFLLIHIKCAKCTPVQAGALFSAFQGVSFTTISTLFSGCFFECCLGWLIFAKIIQNSLPHDPQGDPFGSSNGPREVLKFSLGPGCSHGMSQACRIWL